MASLRILGKKFYACISLPNGTRTQRATGIDVGMPADRAANRKRAQRIADSFEEARRNLRNEAWLRATLEELTGARANVPTIRAAFGEWIAAARSTSKPRTMERYEDVAGLFLRWLEDRADRGLDKFTAPDAQAFADYLSKDRKPTTVRNILKVAQIPFAQANRLGVLRTNPLAAALAGSKMRKAKVTGRAEAFSVAQVAALMHAAEGQWRTAIWIACTTGARLLDVTRMRWGSIDLARGEISFSQAKTGSKARPRLTPGLRDHLLSLNAPDDPMAFIMPALANRSGSGRSGLSKTFLQIVNKAGINNAARTSGKGRARVEFSFHSIRHFVATEGIKRGLEGSEVRTATGHETSAAFENYARADLDKIGDAFAGLEADILKAEKKL
jgi:integrase